MSSTIVVLLAMLAHLGSLTLMLYYGYKLGYADGFREGESAALNTPDD